MGGLVFMAGCICCLIFGITGKKGVNRGISGCSAFIAVAALIWMIMQLAESDVRKDLDNAAKNMNVVVGSLLGHGFKKLKNEASYKVTFWIVWYAIWHLIFCITAFVTTCFDCEPKDEEADVLYYHVQQGADYQTMQEQQTGQQV